MNDDPSEINLPFSQYPVPVTRGLVFSRVIVSKLCV